MDFNREWTQFALEAEIDHFGTARIVKAHNALRRDAEALEELVEELKDTVDDLNRKIESLEQAAWNRLSDKEKDDAIRMG